MSIKRLSIILCTIFIFNACGKKDPMGEPKLTEINNIIVSDQVGAAEIDNKNYTIVVEIPAGIDLSATVVEQLEFSASGSIALKVGDVIDLNSIFYFEVTSADQTVQTWSIEAIVASETPQLDNYDLNLWYKTSKDYYEPGESAEKTIWGTGNEGTQILNKLATVPENLGGENLAARMETLDNGTLGRIFGAPISSGSIFTGVFDGDNIDRNDPEAAIEFGTPFSGRPDYLRITYSYSPGAENKNKGGDKLDYSDACDIYALLEVRLDGEERRLATAWFRSQDVQSSLLTIEIPFNYGELDASFPDYMKPASGLYVSPEEEEFILPTHITFVASSSFDGANFAGAVGSLLVVDDVELVYD